MSDMTVYVDQIFIKVNGTLIDEPTMNALLDAEISTSLGLPAMFILRFADPSLELVDTNKFPLGKPVEIEIKSRGTESTATVIKGEITAIEPEFRDGGDAILTVRGYDKSHRLNRGTKTEAFINVKDSDIATEIAGNVGLSPQVDTTSEVHDHVYQDNQSDLAFLHMLAQRNGFEVFVDDEKLYFQKAQASSAEITLEWGMNLEVFSPRLSISKQVDEVTVKGWDPKEKKAIIGKATSSKVSPSIGFGGWGGQEAKKAIAAESRLVVRRPVYSQAEADTVAQAILDQVNSTFVEADGTSSGVPDLNAGKKVKIESVGEKFSGNYFVTSAIHLYDLQGYKTHFTVEGGRHHLMADLVEESSAFGDLSTYWGGVVPAIVTNNNAPEDWGKVKVKFPWMDDEKESTWARVMGVGAGEERGLYWLPEVNDEVLIVFEHGDFNRPYVIGGLWNGKDAPPEAIDTAVASGKVETRTLKTRAGHIIRFTDTDGQEKIEIVDKDEKRKITFDTSANIFTIDAADGNVEITASAGDITLTGNNVTVEAKQGLTLKGGQTSNIEAGTSLTLKGTTGATLDGGPNLEMKSSTKATLQANAMLELKGGVVNIN
jgi:phage protein D/phage baseplate assembly protein gpV